MKLTLALAIMLLTGGSALASGLPDYTAYTFEDQCGLRGDKDKCLSSVQSFREMYESALRGEYEGQRMMSVFFSSKIDGIAERPFLACAWSHVLLRFGHLEATQFDVQNNETYCNKLSQAELTLALSQSGRIFEALSDKR